MLTWEKSFLKSLWQLVSTIPPYSPFPQQGSLPAFSSYNQGKAAPSCLPAWCYPSSALLSGCCLVLCTTSPHGSKQMTWYQLSSIASAHYQSTLACFATGTKTAKLTVNRVGSVPSYSLCHSPGGRRQWNERATHSKQGQAPAVWQLCFMSHSPFCWCPGHWSCLGQALDQLASMKGLKSST